MLDFDDNVSNFRFVAWDTETTGSSPSSDHVVELAAISFDEDFEHRRFQSLVKPPVPIPVDVVKIHGINDDMVKQAPPVAVVLERFYEFLEWSGSPRVLMAHNAGFDVGMVHRHWNGPREIVLDTCMMAKSLLADLPQHRLESLANHFKVETGRLHRALEDVKVLKEVFLNLLGIAADVMAKKGGGLTLNALVDIAGGYFVLDPAERSKPFRLPPRIAQLESLCGTETQVGILYEDEQYRYITPIEIKVRAFKVYVEAFCHRDNIKKTFRADKILRIKC